MFKNLCAAIKAIWAAWREPPPTREEYEQYHAAKMRAESGVFDDKLHEYLHTNRKAFRELQRAEDKRSQDKR